MSCKSAMYKVNNGDYDVILPIYKYDLYWGY